MSKSTRFIFLILFVWSCSPKQDVSLYADVAESAGIEFRNDLTYTEDFNPYTYRNFFNGAGVALGDVNNDGLLDVYLTGNLTDNKLYLNKGNWQFENITATAGVACEDVWSSGAVFADINGDGYLDIYVCKSGKPEGMRRHNELFINSGDNTFTEQAKAYNLDIQGLSTHAAFFDYDKDGDLDVYILTNSGKSVGVGFELIKDQRETPDPTGGGNKFLRNDDGVFTDITDEAGVYSSTIGFGLGITLGDFNNDTWTDIFISNDFFEKDYLYINNQKGGFTESGSDYFSSMSMGSMGADAADIDNDGYIDLMVTEMLPQNIERRRTKAIYESWDKHQLAVSKGYHHQYPRNVLQRNTGKGQFLEIGRYAGVSATEWSWGALLFDMDNDGLKDIFISNGIPKDLLDRDYLNYMANPDQVRQIIKEDKNVIEELLEKIPSTPIKNSFYRNKGNFDFQEINLETLPGTFSNGSAYGDLDNDGDLDLIVNNSDAAVQVLKNNSDTLSARSLRIKLVGTKKNTWGIGTHIKAWVGSKIFTVDNFPSRGFQSSVDPTLHLGVGTEELIDSVKVYWNAGSVSTLQNVKSNQLIEIIESNKLGNDSQEQNTNSYLVKSKIKLPNRRHQENAFNDFDRELLLPEMLSNRGPKLAVADVNGDGQEDLFLGSAKEDESQLVISDTQGFQLNKNDAFYGHRNSEDIDSEFFDADGDGDMDLYVCSGGRAFSSTAMQLRDRLYINDGGGQFELSENGLPFQLFNSSTVCVTDIDQDGDQDIFVGRSSHPFFYGVDGGGYILQNDGTGRFTDVTNSLAPGMDSIGMVTDATWADIDQDGDDDLMVVGEWMSVQVYINDQGQLSDQSATYIKDNAHGLWNTISTVDIDNDGDMDFIAGNHGLNTFYTSNMRMYRNDFDQNGSEEPIICELRGGQYYPIADKDDLTKQLPGLRKSIFYYKDYAGATIEDLFSPEVVDESKIFNVNELRSMVLMNEGGSFKMVPLPSEAQYSNIFAVHAEDINGDGMMDLILGGNQYLVKPQYGRYDGLNGLILYGSESGFRSDDIEFLDIKGQIRDIESLDYQYRRLIIFAMNDDEIQVYEKY